ncbi:hypothetical protein A6B37_08380 [Achromobacter sp. HZ01]|jgi:hypothetical protein|uniref:hypothetical protein n=1 Tax=Achromobacter sp. HZ01 TaxID=1416886 RepID=UPI000DC235DB|nr:hypothetical protein [Achromobacter sp. HZ01]MBO9328211.1 hypothetical protein [Achromobacter xylosoxidans]RAP66153.1 hypothetical protein A6B37_08380 [Achromobacter sp. HZ01]
MTITRLARCIGAAWLAAALAGCAGAPPLPARTAAFALPRQLHVVQAAPGQPPQDAMLVVQREGAALRWSLFDLVGVPQARQMLEHGQWRNDGFLRPNPQARDLFAALMFAWTPEAELDAAYGPGRWQARRTGAALQRDLLEQGRARWSVRWPDAARAGDFTIVDADGTNWRISPLKEQP